VELMKLMRQMDLALSERTVLERAASRVLEEVMTDAKEGLRLMCLRRGR
jgi:hypothetical protein